MKTVEIRKLDTKKILDELSKVRGDLFKARFEIKNGQSKDNHHIRKNRKQMARIKTVMKQQLTK